MNLEYRDEFDDLIEEYHSPIYRYCYHMLRDREEAEDAVQDVFIKLYNVFSKEEKSNLHKAYIYKVAYNHCINIIKRKKIIKFISFEGRHLNNCNFQKNTYFEKQYFSEEIEIALSKLSPTERTVLILRSVDELSYDEIEEILGKSYSAVRKQYERAKRKIKKYLCEKKEVIDNEGIKIF